jgi:endoglucanase
VNRPIFPPLKTEGNLILDSRNEPIHLHCINWGGFHDEDYTIYSIEYQRIPKLVDFIQIAGFNCVRLQFSAEMVYKNPIVSSDLLVKHPELIGKRAMEIYDTVLNEITSRKIMVVLDYHMLDAGWCCDQSDDNGGWFNDKWTEANATQQLLTMVAAHKNNTWVIGVDLRNEVRPRVSEKKILGLQIPYIPFYPNWGLGGDWDWALAAERIGNAVHSVNPELINFVQGLFVLQPDEIAFILDGGPLMEMKIAQTLQSVWWRPINFTIPNKVVYSAHDYEWHYLFNFTKITYDDYKKVAEANYGYIFDTYPLWIGEFGTGNADSRLESPYWQYVLRYFKERKVLCS